MASNENNLQRATRLSQQLILQQWRPLLFILALGSLITLQLEDSIRGMAASEEGSRWLLQLSMGLWDLFEGVMVFLVLSWAIPQVHPLKASSLEPYPFEQAYVGSFLAEYLRLLAQVLLWGLLLLIPGLVRYGQLMFVPYIALFSKAYRSDKVDAIEYSSRLTKKYLFTILGVFFLASVLQIGLEFMPHLVPGLYLWPVRLLLISTSLLIGIWTYSFMFVLFERAMEEEPWS